MTKEQKTSARKIAVIHQLYFLLIIVIFGLIAFLNFRFNTFEGMQGSGYAFGVSIGPWQWITFIFVCLTPLLLAFITSPKLLAGVNASNKLIRGVFFTFLWWLVPLTIAQVLDGIESPGNLITTTSSAVMAALFFGPSLGRKILHIKQEGQ